MSTKPTLAAALSKLAESYHDDPERHPQSRRRKRRCRERTGDEVSADSAALVGLVNDILDREAVAIEAWLKSLGVNYSNYADHEVEVREEGAWTKSYTLKYGGETVGSLRISRTVTP